MTEKKKPPVRRLISMAELEKILEDHGKWIVSDGKQGQRADLSRAHLSGNDLSLVNLRRANLIEADLCRADLHRADLSGADFSGADLRWTDLNDADLSDADLSGANLIEADLRTANLIEADLRRANLSGAKLSGALLSGANLSEAHLRGADLSRADLSRADLTRAELWLTVLTETNLGGTNFGEAIAFNITFGNVDLSQVQGLETIKHQGPSIIGIDTIHLSQGKIPEIFLRGTGVPETFIASIPSLITAMKPIQFYSCFISYSHKDEAFAKRLHADLQAKGVRCWFAPEEMKIGDKIRPVIDQAIRVYDKLLLVLSKNSIDSDWVEKEVETAFEKEKQPGRVVLFPVRLDEKVMDTDEAWAADIRRTRHIGDFRKWKKHDEYQKAFDRLMRDLQAEKPTQTTSE